MPNIRAMVRMTTAQRATLQLLDDSNRQLGGRVIDNPLANLTGDGVIVGDWLVSANIFNDPEYAAYIPGLAGLQVKVYDLEIMFLPDPE